MATKKSSRSSSSRSSSRKKSSSKKSSGRKSSSASSRRSASGSRKSSTGRKKSSGRKYGPKAQQEVRTEMHHLKQGEHKNRAQAIAIGLSKARREGGKVPPRPKSSRSKKAA